VGPEHLPPNPSALRQLRGELHVSSHWPEWGIENSRHDQESIGMNSLAWHAMLLTVSVTLAACRTAAQGDAPIIVVETSRGSFSFETFPSDAPLTVAHVVQLARSGFYDGQRVHRAIPGFVVQIGDPQTRDLNARPHWGRGAAAASGKPIGAAEISNRRLHTKGAVAMAHMGDPAKADSQWYVTLANRPDLDGQYAVFGQVITGEDVPDALEVGDVISRVSVKP
jgi:cyclophilin family peptidyl-prolyl cis-trans isomerase